MLGLEGVGKTYIMNLLATRPKSAVPPFKAERTGPDGAGHSTFGMNAYVTPERVILLGYFLLVLFQLTACSV